MDYGLIIDLETTGLNPKEDKIIEVGILEFAIGEEMQPFVASMYSELEDPKVEITEEIEKITGIKNAHVHGRSINWQQVQSLLNKASIVIAHNMEFDRGFLQERPELNLEGIHWGCSAKHIDWFGHGFKTRALNYLAADHGFVNPFAHRALFDCAATFRLIAPYMSELIETSYEKEVKIRATGAPFEVKDLLKEQGYRWEPKERVWFKSVFERSLNEERQFLQEKIYQGKPRHQEEVVL